ncbi:MAG: molecular chaperone DnaJ [Hyphomicrobiaceae bacterium]
MLAFIFGLLALVLGLVALRWFANVSPHKLAHVLHTIAGGAAVAAALVLLVRGALNLALPLGMLGIWLWSSPNSLGRFGGPSKGQTSQVTTDHLEMELDHESGEMRGRVLKGFFAGRRVERLKPVELAHLWQDCRFVDPESARLVEAYLDRVHPTWRDDMARAEADSPKGPDGRMTREEALEILGLEGTPDAETIRRAHRELMLKLHPDRGGSTYLAAKVNEAKDVLLEASA